MSSKVYDSFGRYWITSSLYFRQESPFVSNDKQIYLFPAHTLRVAPIKIVDENLYPLKTILIFPLSLFSACAMFRIKINLHIKSCDRGAVWLLLFANSIAMQIPLVITESVVNKFCIFFWFWQLAVPIESYNFALQFYGQIVLLRGFIM